MGNLSLRIISGIVMAVVALGALFLGGDVWTALIAFLGVMMAYEWVHLVRLPKPRQMGLVLSLTVAGSVFVVTALGSYVAAIAMVLALFMTCFIAALMARVSSLRWLCFGVVYIGLPMLALLFLRGLPNGLIITLWLMLVIWASDIFAYFAGKTIGGPKFLPTISPKKTWAGFFGALLGAALVAVGIAKYYDLAGSLAPLIVVSILVCVLSQAGDALESALKRSLDVKDSGSIIPGHGGFFDRLDGLLICAPVVAFALIMRDTALIL